MNIKNLLLVLSSVAALTSCSTAYKSGQTPDDVYYSPARPQQDEYVNVQRQQGRYDDESGTGYNNYDQAYDNYRDDRFLRMSMGSPLRLSAYNDYSMYYGGLGYNTWRNNNYYSMGFNSPWSGLSYWNSFYNPYSAYDYLTPSYYGYGYGGGFGLGGYLPGSVIVKSPAVNPISRPRAFNAAGYGVDANSYSNTSRFVDRPSATSSSNSRYAPSNSGGRYNNSNSGSGVGNTLRRVMGGSSDNTYYNNGRSSNGSNARTSGSSESAAPVRSYEAPARSYSPPASTGGGGASSSSSGGGGGGVTRPTRGGN